MLCSLYVIQLCYSTEPVPVSLSVFLFHSRYDVWFLFLALCFCFIPRVFPELHLALLCCYFTLLGLFWFLWVLYLVVFVK